jgi:hypothetical protein
MAALTVQTPRTFEIPNRTFQDYAVATSATIYEGSALSDTGSATTGTNVAESLVAGENFMGFANANVISALAGATINVVTSGTVKLVVTGVTAASLGAEVYASDGNTFTLTSTSNSAIGRVVKIISGTTVMVRFTAFAYKSI